MKPFYVYWSVPQAWFKIVKDLDGDWYLGIGAEPRKTKCTYCTHKETDCKDPKFRCILKRGVAKVPALLGMIQVGE
jgi:hypothetical protein